MTTSINSQQITLLSQGATVGTATTDDSGTATFHVNKTASAPTGTIAITTVSGTSYYSNVVTVTVNRPLSPPPSPSPLLPATSTPADRHPHRPLRQ